MQIFRKYAAFLLKVDNPSVSIADSPLCTKGPKNLDDLLF